jgi:hypothetical protein
LCRCATPCHHKRFIHNQRKKVAQTEACSPHATLPVVGYWSREAKWATLAHVKQRARVINKALSSCIFR